MSERCPACGLHDCVRECPIGRGAVSRQVYDEITSSYALRLGALKSVLVELHDDHQDSDTFDAGVKYAAKMMLAAIDREPVVEKPVSK